MSGAEIIGLLLGGLPLVISAAEDYRRGFEPLLKWHRYKREFRNFVNSVDLEKRMFDGLLRRLLEFSDIPLEEKQLLLTGTDPEAWRQKDTVEALKVRLGDSYLSCMYILGKMEEDMLELQRMLSLRDGTVDWVKPGEDKWNYQRKRIAHSFSKKGAETITSMERNNRKFRELLDLLDGKLVNTKVDQRKAISKDTTWANIFECIRRHARSLHSALKNGWKCNCMAPHLAALQLQERDGGCSTASFTMAFTSSTSPRTSNFLRKVIITAKSTYSNNRANLRPQPTPVQDWYLDKLRQNIECELSLDAKGVQTSSNSSSISSKYGSSTSFTKSDSIVTLSNVQSGSGTEILVEESHHRSWNTGRKLKTKKSVRLNVPAGFEKARGATAMIQSITETGMPVHATASVKDDIPAPDVRIEDLCSILTICDGNDSWLGYLSDEEHLRHELRSIQAGSIPAEAYELISLENLLAHGNRSKLTRKQRYRLAVILASSMLQLQTTPWLTDQLAKKNIFFYQNGSDILADQPYIRHSFSSNISSPKATPEQKPTQPTQLAPPFAIRNTTRNSLVHLGILLLELCFGQPIGEQTDLRNQYLMDGKAHNDTDFLTARDWVYAVGEEAGEEFEKAVKCCVQCNFDGKLDWSDIQFTQSVYVAVVEPLEKAYISANFV